jgi:hypothetical protein
MLAIPLKTASSVGLMGPLRIYISQEYTKASATKRRALYLGELCYHKVSFDDSHDVALCLLKS